MLSEKQDLDINLIHCQMKKDNCHKLSRQSCKRRSREFSDFSQLGIVCIFRFSDERKLPFLPSTIKFQNSKKILISEIEKMIRERKEKGVSEDDQDLLG